MHLFKPLPKIKYLSLFHEAMVKNRNMASWAVDLLAGARVSDDSSAWVEAFYPKQAPKRAPGGSSDLSVASMRMPAELGVLLEPSAGRVRVASMMIG